MPRTVKRQFFSGILYVLSMTCLFGMSVQGEAMSSSATSFGFTTSGQIGSEGVTGFNVLSYRSQSDTIWGTTGVRYLGKFLSAPLPPGVSTSYKDTPFSISLLPSGLNYQDTWYTQNLNPIVLKGRLNGTITGTDYSSVVASFDPVDPWVDIVKGGVPQTQTFLTGVGPFLIKSNSLTDANMNWMLMSTPVPIPEPGTLAVFSSGLVLAWVARRRDWI